MLVVLTDEQILSTQQICSSCLLATHQGQPRWYQGRLGCGSSLRLSKPQQPALYQCQMGFKLAELDEPLSQANLKLPS
ncbi:MAG: hypothetical protein AB4041_13075 [Microcystaceae cyanobacterium]